MRRRITFPQLLILLMVIAVLVTLAIPTQLGGSKLEANEKAAVAALRSLVRAQREFADLGHVDDSPNGIGEYGTFGEMSGEVAVREANGGTSFVEPSGDGTGFGTVSPVGETYQDGYYFRIYLPGEDGVGLKEIPGGGADPRVDAYLAEKNWCAYAWPQKHRITGNRTFFVNQKGEIVFTESSAYTGPGAPVPPGAALATPGSVQNILGAIASDGIGRDGNTWSPLAE